MGRSPQGTLAPPPIDPGATVKPAEGGKSVGLKILLAGTSNAIASFATNPMDLVKVRQQLLARTPGAPTHFVHVFVDMVKKEGALSPMKGLSGSVVREMSYSGVRMGCFDAMKETIGKAVPRGYEHGFGVKVAAGMSSGMLGAAFANPADLIKVRMQAPGASPRSFVAHWRDILASSGYRGLYRAVWPTTVRAGILTSSQLATYDQTKQWLLKSRGYVEGWRAHVVASAVAGVVCSLASAPVDTIKVRLMNDSQKRYSNAIHCTLLLVREEGPFALYKGLAMCWARLFPQSLISLVVFEQFRRLAGLQPV